MKVVMPPGVPEPISAYYPYGEPNESIRLYAGNMSISIPGEQVTTEAPGQLWLQWMPSPRVRYKVTTNQMTAVRWLMAGADDSTIKLPQITQIPACNAEPASIDEEPSPIEGVFNSAMIGEQDATLSQITFHVVNFPCVIGAPLKQEGRLWRGRMSWQDDLWSVTLDARPECSQLQRKVRMDGGYIVTYTGKITRPNSENFSVPEAREILNMLRAGLSFASGRWVTPMLPVGFDIDGKAVWTDWNIYRLDAWTGSHSPLDNGHVEQYIEFFELTARAWRDPFQRQVLNSAINYFVDGNRPRPLELATSTMQAGLELMAWTELVEEHHLVSATQYRGRPAHENISDLLVRHKIDTSIPASLTALQRAADSEQCQNGPEVITRMRNGVIHPRHGRQMHGRDAWFEAWSLSQQYLILSVLAFLRYSGSYRDPLNKDKSLGAITDVPWIL